MGMFCKLYKKCPDSVPAISMNSWKLAHCRVPDLLRLGKGARLLTQGFGTVPWPRSGLKVPADASEHCMCGLGQYLLLGNAGAGPRGSAVVQTTS